jgi:hypothetical protein
VSPSELVANREAWAIHRATGRMPWPAGGRGLMVRRLSDDAIDAIVGHRYGVRGATLEESADMLADFLEDRAGGAGLLEYVALQAGVLRRAAQTVRALGGLSREGVADPAPRHGWEP